jgi:hypothetical protein
MQLLVIQFTIKMFHIGFMQVFTIFIEISMFKTFKTLKFQQLCTHASQVILRSHNTYNVCTTSMYPHLTKSVILAKYWLWLPDDGFVVKRNMLEQPP